MSLVARFVCWREGHKPSGTFTAGPNVRVLSATSTCLRCGKKLTYTPAAPSP